MYEFSTAQHQTLRLQVDERGITFLYEACNGRGSEYFERGQSWSSIRDLSARLKAKQRYYSKDSSLSVWQKGDELHVKFYALDRFHEETLTFSGAAVDKILCILRNLPNLN
jgi:hypothetical protein